MFNYLLEIVRELLVRLADVWGTNHKHEWHYNLGWEIARRQKFHPRCVYCDWPMLQKRWLLLPTRPHRFCEHVLAQETELGTDITKQNPTRPSYCFWCMERIVEPTPADHYEDCTEYQMSGDARHATYHLPKEP